MPEGVKKNGSWDLPSFSGKIRFHALGLGFIAQKGLRENGMTSGFISEIFSNLYNYTKHTNIKNIF